jgi:hypothetical protein
VTCTCVAAEVAGFVKAVDVLLAELIHIVIGISGSLSATLVSNIVVVLRQVASVNILMTLKFALTLAACGLSH